MNKFNAETLAAMQTAIHNRQTGQLGKGYTDLNEMAHDIQEWQEQAEPTTPTSPENWNIEKMVQAVIADEPATAQISSSLKTSLQQAQAGQFQTAYTPNEPPHLANE